MSNLREQELELRELKQLANVKIKQICDLIEERKIWKYYRDRYNRTSFEAYVRSHSRLENHYVDMKFEEFRYKGKLRMRLTSLYITIPMIGQYHSVCNILIKTRTKDGVRIEPRYDIRKFSNTKYWFDPFMAYLGDLKTKHEEDERKEYEQKVQSQLHSLR